MDERWRQAFLERSRTPDHRRAVREAEDIIRGALERAQRPYVAFSGGKDSTVMMHMVLQQRPSTMVLHWDYGRAYIPDLIHAEILAIAASMGARLRLETSPLYEEQGRQAVGVLGKHMIGWLLPKLAREGYDVSFVGIRSAESGKRRRRIAAGKSLSVIKEYWPVASWSWLDVWAYIVGHDLPYLSIYDQTAPVIGYDQVRFCTLFDPEFTRMAGALDGVLHWRWRNL